MFSSNPLYDGDLAREAESDNDPSTVYLVDKPGAQICFSVASLNGGI